MTAAESLTAWLRLTQTRGVGPDTARRLLSTFGLPENIFPATLPALQKIVSDNIARALKSPIDDTLAALIERTLVWVEQPGNHVLTLADEHYPQALLDIPDPPILLYAKGRIELLSRPSIAVVGSRNATVQGMSNAEKFSDALSRAGLTIISGMALGIDAAAHQGALEGNRHGGGSTVAVIGTGADIVYPARNRALAHRIAVEGCVVSEYPLGMPAIAANFPRRNRLISGLARAVLVVEAAAQSGSLITARTAADQGRDVFAIPGSIHSPLAKGCHQLIKQGAKLIESAQDILDELAYPCTAANAAPTDTSRAPPDPVSAHLLSTMGFDPIEINSLALRCQLDAATVNAQLLNLEMEGWIESLPGGLYRRLN